LACRLLEDLQSADDLPGREDSQIGLLTIPSIHSDVEMGILGERLQLAKKKRCSKL